MSVTTLLLELVSGWNKFERRQEKEYQEPRQHERKAGPLGSDLLIDELQVLLGKQLRKKKTGPEGPWKKRGSE